MRFRPSTLALVAVTAFMLAGLTVADRAITTADQSSARADAQEAAAHVRSFLAVHAAALGAFQGLLAAPLGPVEDSSRFSSLVGAVRVHAPAFRRIWMADATGRVLRDVSLTADGEIVELPTATSAEGSSAPASLARAAVRDRRPHIASAMATSGTRDVALTLPVFVDDRFVGVVGGDVSASTLQAQLPAQREGYAGRTIVAIGSDTIIADTLAAVPASSPRVKVLVPISGGGDWQVTISHAVRGRMLRLVIWAVGLGVLLAVTLGVAHERRQARRIADRSTELERLSDELLRANKAKSEFLANVSHELRTPLNAIVGFTDLLRDGVYGELSPRQSGPVQRIEASANHLRHLVDQVLDLAKIAAGRLEVHSESVALRPFVLDVASDVEALVSERGLSLSIAVGASLPRVRTDPSHLRQILVNLLGNAVKYTEVGGIAVRGRLVGPPGLVPRPTRITGDGPSIERAPDPSRVWVAVQVVDSGVGIAAVDQQRIFDEFEQVNAGPRGDSMRRGTGLGLSISRRLARLLGGDITVESELGKGSTFTLWLPVEAAELQDSLPQDRRPQDLRRAAGAGGRLTPAAPVAAVAPTGLPSTLSPALPPARTGGVAALPSSYSVGEPAGATLPPPGGSR